MVNKKRQNEPQNDESTAESCDEKQSNSPNSNSIAECSHIKNSIDISKLRKVIKRDGLKKEGCSECLKTIPASTLNIFSDDAFEYDKTLWICLKCGTQLCGRARGKHALNHFETPRSDSHSLAANTTTYDVWCYECDNEVNASQHRIRTTLDYLKSQVKNSPQLEEPPIPLPPAPPQPPPTKILSLNEKENNMDKTYSSILKSNMIPNHQPLSSIPGMAKRVQFIDSLPSVRGLTNLGNTCFFNAVLQCLAQTPFLLETLKEGLEKGEEFVLPGGKLKIKEEEIELSLIKGTLDGMGGLSQALLETLEALQEGGFVFTPNKLLDKFTSKCPQFKGYDQHDSHECLRQLLESVRCEDLNRYKKVILSRLGYSNQNHETANDELKQKCKFYGGQAGDRILRPEPVFRGFLVSTLQCQDCYHTSSCHEYFLDISLPISVEKPQPPQRRKSSPETSPTASTSSGIVGASSGLSKHQLKKEKEKERKAKRAAKNHNKRTMFAFSTASTPASALSEATTEMITGGPDGDASQAIATTIKDGKEDDENLSNKSEPYSSSSSSEQSDADVEDNLLDDAPRNVTVVSSAQAQVNRSVPPLYPGTGYDSNGNSELPSPLNPEKRDDSPENLNKDNSNDDENDSGIATSPANTTLIEQEMKGGFARRNKEKNNSSSSSGTANNVFELGISEQGATLVMQRSLSQGSSGGNAADISSVSGIVPPTYELEKLKLDDKTTSSNNEVIAAAKRKATKKKRVRTQSHSDWCTTIAPRYQCEDGECSIQSCLNNFTAVELMTGNNKVGCDECTKRNNGENGKKVYTNATKQFLISSPPAVLILHLKRFQVGPRCMFKKLSKPVSFPMVLDIAPFCGSKIKNLPNVNRKQKKLLYALYGVVEHSGGMYGGHYTAYVKVRQKLSSDDPRWKFLPKGSKAEIDQTDEQLAKLQEIKEKAEAREKARQLRISENDSDDSSSSSSSISDNVLLEQQKQQQQQQQIDENEGAVGGSNTAVADEEVIPSAPPGKWYYVSDSRVQAIDEENVLKAQAYLLFYERIY